MAAMKKVEDEIIQHMETIKNKVLDYSQDELGDASLKMVELEKNV